MRPLKEKYESNWIIPHTILLINFWAPKNISELWMKFHIVSRSELLKKYNADRIRYVFLQNLIKCFLQDNIGQPILSLFQIF